MGNKMFRECRPKDRYKCCFLDGNTDKEAFIREALPETEGIDYRIDNFPDGFEVVYPTKDGWCTRTRRFYYNKWYVNINPFFGYAALDDEAFRADYEITSRCLD